MKKSVSVILLICMETSKQTSKNNLNFGLEFLLDIHGKYCPVWGGCLMYTILSVLTVFTASTDD